MPETPGIRIDSFGVTDIGKARSTNQDNFLIVDVRKSVDVRHSSLPPAAIAGRFGAADAHLFVVADGVGGGPDGDLASAATVSALLAFVSETAGCYHRLTTDREHELFDQLESTVRQVHEKLVAEHRGESSPPATTLTMVFLVWPRAYLIHVGDSRAYVYRRQQLQQLTQDQTLGEYMVATGAWTEEQARRSGPAATLTSAVGGSEFMPAVSLVDLEPGDSLLLCTDGLTRHVEKEQIGAALAGPDSAETAARHLLTLALDGGGRDNIALIVVRSIPA
jgi:protein phosphatase